MALIYLVYFSLLESFLPLITIDDARLAAVVLASLLTLASHQVIYYAMRSLVDNLFFQDTANFADGIALATQQLTEIKQQAGLEFFLTDQLPPLLQVKSIRLHAGPELNEPNSVMLPLEVGRRSLGYLTIGPKKSGRSYSVDERAALLQLQEQVSLVLSGIQLAQAREAAEQAAQLKSDFLTNLSHQLRTPLNTVINSTGLVADGALGDVTPVQANYLNRAVQGSEQLMNLLDEVLDFTKIESGQLTLRLSPMLLAEVVQDAVSIIEGTINRERVALRVEIDPTLPPVMADRQRIRQVLLNLLSNAVKFTRRGHILVRVKRELNQILVSVEDTGIGIAPENLELIFEDYKQVAAIRRKTGRLGLHYNLGTGLGMPITKALVELHGGSIWVESEPNKGSTFTFSLPLTTDL